MLQYAILVEQAEFGMQKEVKFQYDASTNSFMFNMK